MATEAEFAAIQEIIRLIPKLHDVDDTTDEVGAAYTSALYIYAANLLLEGNEHTSLGELFEVVFTPQRLDDERIEFEQIEHYTCSACRARVYVARAMMYPACHSCGKRMGRQDGHVPDRAKRAT